MSKLAIVATIIAGVVRDDRIIAPVQIEVAVVCLDHLVEHRPLAGPASADHPGHGAVHALRGAFQPALGLAEFPKIQARAGAAVCLAEVTILPTRDDQHIIAKQRSSSFMEACDKG